MTVKYEALGISNALSKKLTVSTRLYVVSSCNAKFSEILQTEKFIIYSFEEVTLYTFDDALTAPANWVLALRDMEETLDKIISI